MQATIEKVILDIFSHKYPHVPQYRLHYFETLFAENTLATIKWQLTKPDECSVEEVAAMIQLAMTSGLESILLDK
ncbi:hypothetical protein [Streptococcus sp. UBA3373]|uniref:hypothetical protein n=1 Tax=Streptococcus sp. UBA3373 TaxID=1947562 RepID=UPI0025F77898|nr:hypothetical protein [Streptococcus sp. UBA3373]